MKSLIALLLIVSQTGISQNLLEGKVLNIKTNEPVQYANIFNLQNKSGTYSMLDGSFKLNYNNADKIRISCVGYKSVSLSIDSLAQLKKIEIHLTPSIINLNPFIVLSEVTYTYVGYHKYKHNVNLFSTILGVEYATLIKGGNSPKKIHQIILSKSKKSKGKVRIHLYKVDEKGNPDKDLIQNNLIIDTKDYNKQKEIIIDVSEYNISLAKAGIFIGIEWIESTQKNEKIFAKFNLTKKNETITFKKYNLKEDRWRRVTKENIASSSLNLCVGLKLKD